MGNALFDWLPAQWCTMVLLQRIAGCSAAACVVLTIKTGYLSADFSGTCIYSCYMSFACNQHATEIEAPSSQPHCGSQPIWRARRQALLAVFLALTMTACTYLPQPLAPSGPTPLILFDWEDDALPSVLEAFTAETGIPVELVIFTSYEDVLRQLRTGMAIDVAVVGNHQVGILAAEGLLARIDLHRVPNFRNVTPSFRGLSYDPDNRYSIPYSWGTSGLIAHADFLNKPLDEWQDLWDPAYCGHILLWYWQQRTLISGALKSLGYSANSEDPAALAAARLRLLQLRPCVEIIDNLGEVPRYLPSVVSGQLMLGIGSSHEAYLLRQRGFNAGYYFPRSGALLWGDSFVIPSAGTQKAAAEQFIDYMLRPTVAAQLADANYFRVANDAADLYISPDLRADPAIYPPTELLREAEMLLPLSDEGERRYAEIWEEFLKEPSAPATPPLPQSQR
jgi:spermidine/putrescine transport system substrate-binding protein